MSPITGSRHYQGPGLGEAMWRCPSCNAENLGPIPQGCVHCGAGTPGQKVEAPPPPAPPPEGAEQLGPFDRWALAHPQASLEEAFDAGYREGLHAAAARASQPRPESFAPEGAVARTIVAALAFFRDQVLAQTPYEVTTGEWLSAAQVTELIARLQAQGG